MKISSPYWDEKLGVCTKHKFPCIPCPACMAGEGDEDLEFVITPSDQAALDWNPELCLEDLVPDNITNPTFIIASE